MDIGIIASIAVWTAAVSALAASKIHGRAIAVLTAAACSVGIPPVLGILFTSLFPWSPLGPEEFLQKSWENLIGLGAVHLPLTLAAWLGGIALGFVAGYVVRLRITSKK